MEKITLINSQIETYSETFASWPNNTSKKIKEDTENELQYADMLSGNQVTGLLRMLILASGARKVAEIGMFTGLATLAMSEVLPPDGVIYSLEMNQRYHDLAVKNLSKSPHFDKIKILFGDAHLNVQKLPEGLDFVFVDADKDLYPFYYETLLPKLVSGGIMVFDNVFWHGGVLAEKKDRKSASIHKLNEIVQNDPSVENVMLTVRDGLLVLRKR